MKIPKLRWCLTEIFFNNPSPFDSQVYFKWMSKCVFWIKASHEESYHMLKWVTNLSLCYPENLSLIFELFWKKCSSVSGLSVCVVVALWLCAFVALYVRMSVAGANKDNKVVGNMSWCVGTNEIWHLTWHCLRWLNTVLAVWEYMSFAKSRQEKGCNSQAETWQVKNILMKYFDLQVK